MGEVVDFFVSYTRADEAWAEWISWQLEDAGFRTRLQKWDIRPGSNFVLEMQSAATQASRTIAVLSPSYFTSGYGSAEWAAALADDPVGNKLLPIRVRDCSPTGLLKAVVYIDLVGKNKNDARAALIGGIGGDRAKPSREPGFPGDFPSPKEFSVEPPFPARSIAREQIHPLEGEPEVSVHLEKASQLDRQLPGGSIPSSTSRLEPFTPQEAHSHCRLCTLPFQRILKKGILGSTERPAVLAMEIHLHPAEAGTIRFELKLDFPVHHIVVGSIIKTTLSISCTAAEFQLYSSQAPFLCVECSDDDPTLRNEARPDKVVWLVQATTIVSKRLLHDRLLWVGIRADGATLEIEARATPLNRLIYDEKGKPLGLFASLALLAKLLAVDIPIPACVETVELIRLPCSR